MEENPTETYEREKYDSFVESTFKTSKEITGEYINELERKVYEPPDDGSSGLVLYCDKWVRGHVKTRGKAVEELKKIRRSNPKLSEIAQKALQRGISCREKQDRYGDPFYDPGLNYFKIAAVAGSIAMVGYMVYRLVKSLAE